MFGRGKKVSSVPEAGTFEMDSGFCPPPAGCGDRLVGPDSDPYNLNFSAEFVKAVGEATRQSTLDGSWDEQLQLIVADLAAEGIDMSHITPVYP